MILSVASVANATKIGANYEDTKIIILDVKTIEHHNKDGNLKTVNLYYEENEKALYIFTHGSITDGHLYIQKRKEKLDDCINRYISENSYKIGNLPIKKIYLGACYEYMRHEKEVNPKNLYIGHNNLYNADMYEIAYNDCAFTTVHFFYTQGRQRIVCFGEMYEFQRNENAYKAAKKAAKESGYKWAVDIVEKIRKKG